MVHSFGISGTSAYGRDERTPLEIESRSRVGQAVPAGRATSKGVTGCGPMRKALRKRQLTCMKDEPKSTFVFPWFHSPFARLTGGLLDVSRIRRGEVKAPPIRRINSCCHPSVKARRGPIPRTTNVIVLHRIEMDVVEMPLEVVFRFERVFPESPLPDSSPAFAPAA